MKNESTRINLSRKGKFINQVQLYDGKPLFSWIEISLTELCNRKCVFCPRCDNSYPNQNLHMSLELLRKMGDELRSIDYQGAVALCGYGEPMLHDDIFSAIQLLQGIDVEIVTNGDQLTVDVVNKLYEVGTKHIQVSMYDGPQQVELFESIFSDVDDEMYTLRDRWYGEDDDYGLCLTNRAGVMDMGSKLIDTTRPCHYLAYSLMIDWNGDVLLCSQDWHKKRKFGNLTSSTLCDVWFSTGMSRYRTKLLDGDRSNHPCNLCNVLGTRLGGEHAVKWKSVR